MKANLIEQAYAVAKERYAAMSWDSDFQSQSIRNAFLLSAQRNRSPGNERNPS